MVIKQLYLNSRRSINAHHSSTANRFKMRLNPSIKGIKDIKISELALNFVPLYPNIPRRSSEITIVYNGHEDTITIDPRKHYVHIDHRTEEQETDGFASFVKELNDQIAGVVAENAEWTGLEFNFDFQYDLLGVSHTAEEDRVIEFKDPPSGRSMINRLGLMNTNVFTIPAKTSGDRSKAVLFTNPPRLSRTEAIYIASDLTNGSSQINDGTNDSYDIIKMIPIPIPTFGALPNYTAQNEFQQLINIRQTLHEANFEILDDELKPLELYTQGHLSMELFIEYAVDDAHKEEQPETVPLKLGGRGMF